MLQQTGARLWSCGLMPGVRQSASAMPQTFLCGFSDQTGEDTGPTDPQLSFLSQLRYSGPSPATKRAATQLIQKIMLDAPATAYQLEALAKHCYFGQGPATYVEAKKLLDALPPSAKQLAFLHHLLPGISAPALSGFNRREASLLIDRLLAK